MMKYFFLIAAAQNSRRRAGRGATPQPVSPKHVHAPDSKNSSLHNAKPRPYMPEDANAPGRAPPMKKCWPCRRRRLKCDGTVPRCVKCRDNGVECTYTKPLTWVNGVASRGRMMGCTFDEVYAGRDDSSGQRSLALRPAYAPDRRLLPIAAGDMSGAYRSAPVSRALTDPIFQDLGYNERFLVDYYQQRVCPAMFLVSGTNNPYSKAISMIGSSPALVSAILAVAACHSSHGATGSPLYSFLDGRAQRIYPASDIMFPTNPASAMSIPQSDLLNQYLVLKHKSLRHLSVALSDPVISRKSTTVVTILFLALLELMESGAGFWSVHIEGAKKLLEVGVSDTDEGDSSILKPMIDELILFDTFGSTLIRPGVLTRSIRSRLNDTAEETPRITGIGCPTEIILAVDFISSQRQVNLVSDVGDPEPHIQCLFTTLRTIQHFDIHHWVSSVTCVNGEAPSVLPNDLVHIGTIWKLAAEIYATSLLYNLTEDPSLLLPLVDVVRGEYGLLGPSHYLLYGLVWPTFVAGAASTRPEQRVWALGMLETIWSGALCGNAKNATLVLERLWEKQDLARGRLGTGDMAEWDWISELSSLEDRWIFL